MKSLFSFLLLLLSVGLVQAQQEKPIDSIQVTNALLKKVQTGKVLLVDVRTPEEYTTGHLKNSLNIDYKNETFKTQIDKLDKKKTVYLYCRTGNRSGKSVEILKSIGFQNVYNIGGLEYLKSVGFPAE